MTVMYFEIFTLLTRRIYKRFSFDTYARAPRNETEPFCADETLGTVNSVAYNPTLFELLTPLISEKKTVVPT